MKYLSFFAALLIGTLLVVSTLETSAAADEFHSWENSLEGWLSDPGSNGATAVPTSLAEGAPVEAITEGDYALKLVRNKTGWTSVVRAPNEAFFGDLISNTTIDLDIYVPPGSFQSWGSMEFQIEGQDMFISKSVPFNATDNSYNLSWDYGLDPAFNPYANWTQFTMAIQGGGSTNPVYVDNFRLSNSYTDPSNYTLDGNYKVFLDEQFDGDLKIWREPSNVYSGPDSVSAGDGSLIRASAGEPGWRTRGRGSNELTGRSLLGNKQADWAMDPWYEGTTGSPLGVNPFKLQNGKLYITADKISPTVLNGLPEWDGSHNVHDMVDYTTGYLTTQNLVAVKYGRFEMRAQMPSGRGMWPAFWLLTTQPGWPPEIDILEAHGQSRNQVHYAAHLTQEDLDAGFSPAGGWVPTDVEVPGEYIDITTGFNDYAMEWSADEIIWYFNDVEIGRMATPPSMNQEMFLIVNLAVGGPGSWPGPPSPTTPFPQELVIDYIRVSQLRADFDDQGDVDEDDRSIWENAFGATDKGDTDSDGDTDGADFLVWQRSFSPSVGSGTNAASVPEPATAAMAVLCALFGGSFGRRTRCCYPWREERPTQIV